MSQFHNMIKSPSGITLLVLSALLAISAAYTQISAAFDQAVARAEVVQRLTVTATVQDAKISKLGDDIKGVKEDMSEVRRDVKLILREVKK